MQPGTPKKIKKKYKENCPAPSIERNNLSHKQEGKWARRRGQSNTGKNKKHTQKPQTPYIHANQKRIQKVARPLLSSPSTSPANRRGSGPGGGARAKRIEVNN